MQAPDWADFEPGVLIPEIPVPVTTTTPPQSDTVDDAEFMETQLEGGKDGASQPALLLLESTDPVASRRPRRPDEPPARQSGADSLSCGLCDGHPHIPGG